MKKRIFSIALAGVLSATVIAGGVVSTAAAGIGSLPTYTPADASKCHTYYMATPGQWVNEVTEKEGNPAGIYWWDGDNTPDDAAGGHGWPGYKTEDVNEEGVPNLHKTLCPKNAPMIIFSNYFDGGMDVNDPAFKSAKQGIDEPVEFWCRGDSDYYPDYWWDYVEDECYKDGGEDMDFSVFGDYASNFFDETEYKSGCAVVANNMVYVLDLRPETMKISTTIVPEGMPTYEGAFYFYYGKGNYGIWPTLDLAKEQEKLEFDENGNVDTTKLPEGCKVDEWGSIVRTYDDTDYVIFGNFTGKYWADNTAPEIPTTTADPNATTVPAPSADATGATQARQGGSSSTTTGTNSANGAVATGEASVAVIAFVVIIAAIGVFYFTRKKYSK